MNISIQTDINVTLQSTKIKCLLFKKQKHKEEKIIKEANVST